MQAYGLNGAAVRNSAVVDVTDFSVTDPSRKRAFGAGVQLGYNWQVGALVFGVEGDLNWLGGRRGGSNFSEAGYFYFAGEYAGAGAPVNIPTFGIGPATVVPVANRAALGVQTERAGTIYNDNVTTSGGNRSAWLSTLRGRAGFAFDRFMVYGTGGLAFQSASTRTSSTQLNRTDCRPDAVFQNFLAPATVVQGACVTTSNTYDVASSKSRSVGWAAGGGFEWALTNSMSLGFEYLHADFGRTRVSIVDPVLTAVAIPGPRACLSQIRGS